MNGRRVEDVLTHPVTRTVVEANKATYGWAHDPRFKEVMSLDSPILGEPTHPQHPCEPRREECPGQGSGGNGGRREVGDMYIRCPGYDGLHALAATTWETDQDPGTDYHQRFMAYLERVQREDLCVAWALTELRGDRKKRALEWPDPYLSLKVVERKRGGIVVRGAKINISGAYAGHEMLLLPQSAKGPGEEDYAIAFAVPTDAPGITYICQYSPYSAERACPGPLGAGKPSLWPERDRRGGLRGRFRAMGKGVSLRRDQVFGKNGGPLRSLPQDDVRGHL